MFMPAQMTDAEIKAFLDAKPGWIILSTIGLHGYPHSVPIGYFRLGDDIYLGCRDGTQKVKNILRNPKVSLVLESGTTRRDIKGVMIQGHATVYNDPENTLRLGRAAARLRGVAEEDLPQTPRPGVAYIKVEPQRIISWDYSQETDRLAP
jgi:nitroimidazol reductase NimA-like FMN-containing flavoprotein (pyridoxamine 5'-phosphate oxidase superfamily)